MKTVVRSGGAILLALALAGPGGCLGGRAPERRHFRLVVPEPAAVAASVLLPGTLAVERPRTDALLAERSLVFRPSPASSELRQYPYTSWTDAPADLVQRAAIAHLAEARVADTVLRAGLATPADWLLVSRIDRFERVGGGAPVVEVGLELAWLRAAGRESVYAGRYRVTRRADSDRVEDIVGALGVALGELLDRAVADLEAGLAARAGS